MPWLEEWDLLGLSCPAVTSPSRAIESLKFKRTSKMINPPFEGSWTTVSLLLQEEQDSWGPTQALELP